MVARKYCGQRPGSTTCVRGKLRQVSSCVLHDGNMRHWLRQMACSRWRHFLQVQCCQDCARLASPRYTPNCSCVQQSATCKCGCIAGGQGKNADPHVNWCCPLISCYKVELLFNDAPVAPGKQENSWANWTQWDASDIASPFEAGTLTAIGTDEAGVERARDSYVTPGKPASLALTVDVPSLQTGTGSALMLDGQVGSRAHTCADLCWSDMSLV